MRAFDWTANDHVNLRRLVALSLRLDDDASYRRRLAEHDVPGMAGRNGGAVACRRQDGLHLNLAYRWFCRLGLDRRVPDHSNFSRNRRGRFRQSDILPHLFETVVFNIC
jgi:hypothetical protein